MKSVKNIFVLTATIVIFVGCYQNPPIYKTQVDNSDKLVSETDFQNKMDAVTNEQVNPQCKATLMDATKLSNKLKKISYRLSTCKSMYSSYTCSPIQLKLCSYSDEMYQMANKLISDCKGTEVEDTANYLGSDFKKASVALKQCS